MESTNYQRKVVITVSEGMAEVEYRPSDVDLYMFNLDTVNEYGTLDEQDEVESLLIHGEYDQLGKLLDKVDQRVYQERMLR